MLQVQPHVTVSVRLPLTAYQRVVELAERNGVKLSQALRDVIERGTDQDAQNIEAEVTKQ